MNNILNQFQLKSEVAEIVPLKIGHINDSFVVKGKNPADPYYFLQKINHHIFKDVEGLQNNIRIVTDHLRKKYQEAGETDIEQKVLQLIPTNDGKWYFKDSSGDYWRVYVHIKNTHSYEAITPALAYEAGKAYGDFHFFFLPFVLSQACCNNGYIGLGLFPQCITYDPTPIYS